MTQHHATIAPVRRRRPRRRGAGAVLLVLLVGAGAWLSWPVAARALGLEGPEHVVLRWEGPQAEPAEPAPAPTALDPGLEAAFAAAQAEAAAQGVVLTLTSGWRSPEEQQALVEEALATYGSPEEAHRWVLPPEKSAHVAGLAIDVGPVEGATWLADNAAHFGLCRTYLNEWWHFEPVPADGVCPEPLPDSSWGWR